MIIAFCVILVLLILVQWSQYRKSPVYKARLKARKHSASCQQQHAEWSVALRETTAALREAPELLRRAETVVREQVLAPRRSTVLAVDNLRQFKGIGKDTVNLLLAGGYTSADRLNQSITRFPGIGPGKAERILAAASQLKAAAEILQPTENEKAEIDQHMVTFSQQFGDWVQQAESHQAELAATVELWKGEWDESDKLLTQLESYSLLRYATQRSESEAEVAALLTVHDRPIPATDGKPPKGPSPPAPPRHVASSSRTARGAREALPVPPPTTSTRFVEISPVSTPPSVDSGNVQVRLNRQSPFIMASKRHRTAEVKPAPFVPFQQYWPTFGHLSQSQLAYYLWWRSEWLAGRFIQVDLSYVFLFAYELLNLSFEPTPQRSFEILARLFESYRDSFHSLWNYAEWVGDLAWELGLEDQALDWYGRDDTTVDVALSLGQSRGQMLLSASLLLNTFRLRRSGYFSEHEDAVIALLDEAIHHASEWCQRNKSSTLLETLAGGRVERSTRALYPSAVIERQLARTGPTYQLFRATSTISTGVQTLARLVENAHRESTGNKRLLQVETSTLPAGLPEYLLERLGPAKIASPTPSVQFDEAVVRQIRQDSSETEALLGQLLADTTGDAEPAQEATEAVPIIATPTPVGVIESVFGQSHTGGMAELWPLLDPLQASFLELFAHSSSIEKGTAVTFVREHAEMLVSFVDGINELGLDPLGDVLLEEDDESIRVAESFVGQLEAFSRQREAHQPC